MTELEKAIDIISSYLILDAELPEWEGYPEIGEYDWEAIQEAVIKKKKDMLKNISVKDFLKAYAFLGSRANGGEGDYQGWDRSVEDDLKTEKNT